MPGLQPWAPGPPFHGAILACIGIAGVVRRQWIHNERLPYPIASITYSLLEEPSGKQRFSEFS